MEYQYVHQNEGQECGQEDLNLLGENSALADDRVLAELLRLVPYDGSTVRRAVVPLAASINGWSTHTLEAETVVKPSGSADAKVRIGPCRVIIGSRASTPQLTKWRDIRSAILVGSTTQYVEQQLAATSSNNRWDLIYARVDVDIDDSSVTRYVRDANKAVSSGSYVTRKKTTVTIGVVQGIEASEPTRPSLPSDSGSAYYVPLAYVLLTDPHTLSSTIAASQIYEVAPVVPLSAATGASSIAPARAQYRDGGPIVNHASRPWSIASGRPGEHLPPTMVGGLERLIALDFINANPTIPLGSSVVLDDTVDWRKRLFWSVVQVATSIDFAWTMSTGTGLPAADFTNLGAQADMQMGQSFSDEGSSPDGGRVLVLTQSRLSVMAASSQIYIYVDLSTGELKADVAATDPAVRLFIWIRASGQYANA